ncbi:MAG: hypothetical protein WD988_03705 [Candidatus Curtissbacteria bacterium]
MAERRKAKFTPIETIFSDSDSQVRVKALKDGIVGIDGVKGLVVGLY